MAGIYIHIPFCASKCAYCAFYSIASRRTDMRAFARGLAHELSLRADILRQPIDTIYIGGGTPSLLDAADFSYLAGLLRRVPAIGNGDLPTEFTIEVNPDDVEPERIKAWADAGVNRVSMGVQSFVDSELKAIGRRHDAATATAAYRLLSRTFRNISLDLMFGLPGQTPESWQRSLDACIALRPAHISAYSLMYEERTLLTRMLAEGRLQPASETDSETMYGQLLRTTSAAGYERYEISNFALPGCRSVHNSSYWQGKPYIGLGPGASGYDGDCVRYTNLPDIKGYMAALEAEPGADALESISETEHLSKKELEEEYILTRLRTCDGIGLADYCRRFGKDCLDGLLGRSSTSIEAGNLLRDADAIRLSQKGLLISDEIMAELMP